MSILKPGWSMVPEGALSSQVTCTTADSEGWIWFLHSPLDWGINSNIASNATVSVLELPGNAMPQVWFKASILATLTTIHIRKCGDLMLDAFIPRIGWRKTLQKKSMESLSIWGPRTMISREFSVSHWYGGMQGSHAAGSLLASRLPWKLQWQCLAMRKDQLTHQPVSFSTQAIQFLPVVLSLFTEQSAWKNSWGLRSGSKWRDAKIPLDYR